MTEEKLETPVQISTEQPTTEVTPNPFASNAWAETIPEPKKEEAAPIQNTSDKTEIKTEEKEEILEPKDWLRKEFDTDDVNVLKAEREELKTLREKSKPFEFKNEDSRKALEYIQEGKIDDLYDILSIRKKVDKLSSADLNTNKELAPELVKFGIKNDNPNLNDDEVDFIFNEKYAKPTKPIKDELDEDADYEVKLNAWKQQVENVDKRMVIEAKMSQPKIAQLKNELVIPEINKKTETANEPDPAVIQQIRDNFLNKLESDYSKTEGFSTQVKDESVEIPVSFKIPDEDKVAIKKVLEGNFDVDNYINSRWFGEKGEPKIQQIVSDLYLLNNTDKVLSGIANNSANQRLVQFRKESANINVNGNAHQNTFQPNADGKANVSPFAKDAWSEKAPQNY